MHDDDDDDDFLEFFHNKVQNGQTGDLGVRAADLVVEERRIEHARVTSRTAVQNVLELVMKPENATFSNVHLVRTYICGVVTTFLICLKRN